VTEVLTDRQTECVQVTNRAICYKRRSANTCELQPIPDGHPPGPHTVSDVALSCTAQLHLKVNILFGKANSAGIVCGDETRN